MYTKREAEKRLHQVLGPKAIFRDGQWEAIDALVNHRKRVLVVQRTGWGKSLVYFLATLLLRKQGQGITLLISPLLSLMRNQIEAATRWGLQATSLNSTNAYDHDEIEDHLLSGKLDLLLISPERLANERFQHKVWEKLRQHVGLMVIDEAHCISDWGHDFRPNYRRIMGLLDQLPANTPVLGTTATASNRVVDDVSEILGTMEILRGPLTRESLRLYVYPEARDQDERLTLLSHLLHRLKGSGIIYCTTTRDCEQVTDWLQREGFKVKAYFAAVEETSDEDRPELEQQLLRNEIRALVSSVALGMGFDKPDLSFVIHYQLPGSIINYYQQIGRAGRGIDEAHIILMHGEGDQQIQEYFIKSAFPKPAQVEQVLAVLTQLKSANQSQLRRAVNIRHGNLEKILTHLEVEGIVVRNDSHYELINANRQPDYERWEQVTEKRIAELNQMKAYVHHADCLMRYLAEALDDPTPPHTCGKCKNCLGSQSKFIPNPEHIMRAQQFLKGGQLTFEPRKRFPSGFDELETTVIEQKNETGVALCYYRHAGWGEHIQFCRVNHQLFSEGLVNAAAQKLRDYWTTLDTPPLWITCVPSLRRPHLVPDLAQRLAQKLGLTFLETIEHLSQHPEQSEMESSYHQFKNLRGRFKMRVMPLKSPVLLVDDLVSSKWTFTVIGQMLQLHGSGPVYPFALGLVH
ncbi:MAG: RecQ family ATP-dependent DNA helicase [Anaerolineae bacterium]|jgi:ATP-dependent DNA helicase RecQ|nr:RecQ family ATP-dependent DNA helicase [Anaerolineae bacterium]